MLEILDLPARHTNRAPVFVIGAARSGTSMLCTLLRRYLKVSFGTESQFIVRVYQRLPSYGDVRQPSNLRRLVDDIARERCFERWSGRFGFVLDADRVYREALDRRRSYAGVLHAIFGQFAAYHGMERWGDKTPEDNDNLPVRKTVKPQYRSDHVYRTRLRLSTARRVHPAQNRAQASHGG